MPQYWMGGKAWARSTGERGWGVREEKKRKEEGMLRWGGGVYKARDVAVGWCEEKKE